MEVVKHATAEFTAADGTSLVVERWTPEQPAKFAVAVVHGAGEHVGRYARMARELNELGGYVFGLDHRGQGSSGGVRGHVASFEVYAADLAELMMHEVAESKPGQAPDDIPWFIFGHSMGGLITLTYLLTHAEATPLRGAILSSPLLGLAMKVNPFKVMLGKVAGALMPKLSLPSDIPPDYICRDPDEVERYAADERRATVVSAGWFSAMNRAIARVDAEVASIVTPLLWYIGTGDKICDHTHSERVFAKLADDEENDQVLRTFEGYYHELHNEPEADRAKVIEMIHDWIEARV